MAPFFVRSESSGKKRPAGLLRRAFCPFRRGAVSAEQGGAVPGSRGGRSVRTPGSRRRSRPKKRGRPDKRSGLVKSTRRFTAGASAGQIEAERPTGKKEQLRRGAGGFAISGEEGRLFPRKRGRFILFFIPRTGENAVSEGGKIFFARTVQSKVDFFHVA